MKHLITVLLALTLLGCGPASDEGTEGQTDASEPEANEPMVEDDAMETAEEPSMDESMDASASDDTDRLGQVLEAQPEEVRARYDDRHPRETLEFFGIEPGMTVVEGLPGGGWYTRILLPYLGSNGELIAANYPLDMWPNFPFVDDDYLAQMREWPETFAQQAKGWCEDDCADVRTFWFGDMPAEIEGAADAVLFIRLMHNMANFQNAGVDNYLDQAIADAFSALKPGGILGVVQHEAREDMPDEWADGSAGYLKRFFVVERAESAGFELVDESDINANPNDRPTTDEVVWRLPPSLRVPEDAENAEALGAKYEAIGESHRMTLKFRKPDA
ncbi:MULTISPECIES: class I SAM-dependent methyltransferase [unclassified Wenzhouxiangella]|uniref:class I SAM-dependent methyltransferase n=1 Tax=unclassified Wenzhouxiangella TaxID=2613841 RepID=UPI000E32BDCE|nr:MULTISPECIES: class I SAM-dependent methyltransferase [unclassified Wenzhouxiangella]RFF27014.1 methyltransferase [Wenzhouxiangella sp. 15181]RFP69525.1 methyltransferase [Wenzhouxiangella sp. 15190]